MSEEAAVTTVTSAGRAKPRLHLLPAAEAPGRTRAHDPLPLPRNDFSSPALTHSLTLITPSSLSSLSHSLTLSLSHSLTLLLTYPLHWTTTATATEGGAHGCDPRVAESAPLVLAALLHSHPHSLTPSLTYTLPLPSCWYPSCPRASSARTR